MGGAAKPEMCQSCGMPMGKTEEQGTRFDGTASTEYCTHCYRNGAFTNPSLSLDGMIDRIAQILGKKLTSEEKERYRRFLGTLTLWKR